ncbi:MAG TPA: hypothetical protein VIK45_19930 [Candidatus Dormibacteraeota bacterium]
MKTYLVTNRAPRDFKASPEAFVAWNAWFDELGESLVERGNPTFATKEVGNCGPETALGGYSLIQAPDLEAAIALVKTHPLTTRGGGVEVGELTILNSGRELITKPARRTG